MNIKAFRLTMLLIKYGLAFCTLLFVMHCSLLLLGYNVEVTEPAFCLSWFWAIVLFLAIVALRMCWLSKSFFVYDFMVSQCIVGQRTIEPFGDYLNEARLIVVIIGVILLTILAVNKKQYNLNCHE